MESDQNTSQPTISIYTTPTCGFCHMAKNYLQSIGAPFEERDITTDDAAYEQIIEKTNQLGVPVIEIDNIVIVGFDRTKLDVVLREKRFL